MYRSGSGSGIMTEEHGDVIRELVVEAAEETDIVADETVDAVPALELPEDPDETIAVLIGELLAARGHGRGGRRQVEAGGSRVRQLPQAVPARTRPR